MAADGGVSMPDRYLFEGPEWDFEKLRRVYGAIEEIALGEMGLDIYPNQIEVITSEQMLDAYASIGLPLMYRHWSFGKRFAREEALYRHGLQGLAYEIVINSSPCISYIMEENSMTMQSLVIAHAAFGHNHFFKNNYLFRQWTDATGILDYLTFARDFVTHAEESHGVEAVEQAEFSQLLDGMRQRIDADAKLADGIRLFKDFAVDPARMQHQRRYKAADAPACNDDLHSNSPPFAAGMPVCRRAPKMQ